jgi:hypothetical protein
VNCPSGPYPGGAKIAKVLGFTSPTLLATADEVTE